MDTCVLSTKKLSMSQRELLLNSGLSFVEYDAISIAPLNFTIPPTIENDIFTSQNGARSILFSESRFGDCFCVGEKTEELLVKNGFKVIKKAENSSELGDFISKNYQNRSFFYFCGNERRDELPNLLKREKITFYEVKTYKTELKPKKFDKKWDGILFFSPSGVESFSTNNNLKETTAFCIGETTATAAKKYTNNVIVANSTTVESVIAKTVKTLKNDKD